MASTGITKRVIDREPLLAAVFADLTLEPLWDAAPTRAEMPTTFYS